MSDFEALHRDYKYLPEDAETAVLFVHGICGSPRVFGELMTFAAAAGCAVSAPLLPGHGSSSQEFAVFGRNDWQRRAAREAGALRDRYKRLVLVGHSMGGLLTLPQAAQNGADGLLLINTPMMIHITRSQLSMAASTFLKLGGDAETDEKKNAYDSTFAVRLDNPVTALMWMPQIRDLFMLMLDARGLLGGIDCKTVVAQSKNDETVDPKSADALCAGIHNSSALWLGGSLHAWFSALDMNALKTALSELIKDRL